MKKGFTILELLVVMSILAFLYSLAIYSFKYFDSLAEESLKNDIRNAVSQEMITFTKYGVYESLSSGSKTGSKSGEYSFADGTTLWIDLTTCSANAFSSLGFQVNATNPRIPGKKFYFNKCGANHINSTTI